MLFLFCLIVAKIRKFLICHSRFFAVYHLISFFLHICHLVFCMFCIHALFTELTSWNISYCDWWFLLQLLFFLCRFLLFFHLHLFRRVFLNFHLHLFVHTLLCNGNSDFGFFYFSYYVFLLLFIHFFFLVHFIWMHLH